MSLSKRTAAVLAAAFVLAGCGAGTFVPTTYYVLAPVYTVAEAPSQGTTLGMRPLADIQSQRRAMTYLDEDRALRSYPYVQWSESAGAMATRAVLDAALQTGRFADAGDTADLPARPGLNVVGSLRQFTEVRGEGGPAAVCTIHLEARAWNGAAWTWDFTASEPMDASSPGALARAMEKALGAVASEAANALAALDPPARPGAGAE